MWRRRLVEFFAGSSPVGAVRLRRGGRQDQGSYDDSLILPGAIDEKIIRPPRLIGRFEIAIMAVAECLEQICLCESNKLCLTNHVEAKSSGNA
jgi:hypothetical protein